MQGADLLCVGRRRNAESRILAAMSCAMFVDDGCEDSFIVCDAVAWMQITVVLLLARWLSPPVLIL